MASLDGARAHAQQQGIWEEPLRAGQLSTAKLQELDGLQVVSSAYVGECCYCQQVVDAHNSFTLNFHSCQLANAFQSTAAIHFSFLLEFSCSVQNTSLFSRLCQTGDMIAGDRIT